MANYRNIPVYLLLVTALLFAAAESALGGSVMSENSPGRVESTARHLMHDLKKHGFEVRRGYFKNYSADDCDYTYNKIGSCYGNNPAAPYVVLTVPPWPEEYVDPKYGNMWGPSHKGYNDIYRLDPREAIVILGQLPPPGAYFSEQTWVFTRQGEFDKSSPQYKYIDENLHDFLPIFFANVPERDGRIQVTSSLSNIVNNVVIERQSKKSFDQIRHFIITPDRIMDQEVRKAFARISVKKKHVFTEPIPSNMNFGLDKDADDFTNLIRYAKPDNKRAGEIWRKNLPLVVLRVRDTRSHRMPEPYPEFTFDSLELRDAESELYLKQDLGDLLYAVSKRWRQSCAESDCSDQAESFILLQEDPIDLVGPLCLPIGMNCLLDTWDTAYQIYGPGSADKGVVYAVAGTLGTETGNATYVGFGINQKSKLKGVANLFDEKLKGTANGYAGKVSNTGKFYLYYFTRDCSGLGGLTDGHCVSLKDYIPQNDQFVFSVRDYIKPDTQRGPDSSLVLPSMVIKLQRP